VIPGEKIIDKKIDDLELKVSAAVVSRRRRLNKTAATTLKNR
jgi:hypothetical protein